MERLMVSRESFSPKRCAACTPCMQLDSPRAASPRRIASLHSALSASHSLLLCPQALNIAAINDAPNAMRAARNDKTRFIGLPGCCDASRAHAIVGDTVSLVTLAYRIVTPRYGAW